MSKKEQIRNYKVLETQWDATEELAAVEEVEYEEKTECKQGRVEAIITEKSRLWGFFNENDGELVVPLMYHCVWKFNNGLSKVRLGNKWGLINRSNEVVVPIKYTMLYAIGNDLWQAQIGNKWGVIDSQNRIVVEIKWDWAYPPKDGKVRVRQGEDYYILNLDGVQG